MDVAISRRTQKIVTLIYFNNINNLLNKYM